MTGDNLADRLVTGPALAGLIGVSERRVRELRDQGVIPDAGKGKYRLGAAITAYCAHLRPAAGRRANGGSDSANALDMAKIAVLDEQRERLALLNAQIRGESIQISDLEAVVGALCDAIRQRVLALPTRATPRVIGKAEADVLEILTEEAHDACGDLATTELVGATKDRARRRASRGASGDEDPAEAGAAAAADPKPVG